MVMVIVVVGVVMIDLLSGWNAWMWRSVDVDVDVNGDVNMDGLWWTRRLPGVVGGKWASVDGGGRCTCVHTILMRRPLLKEYSLLSWARLHKHHTLLSMCDNRGVRRGEAHRCPSHSSLTSPFT